jgi:hypothetical protein
MLQAILSAMIALITIGCGGPRYVDYFPYHDDGTPKPRVALMNIVDSSHSGLPWNVSEELSQSLYYELMNSGQLYVLSPVEVGPIWAKQESTDFFDGEMSFIADFCNVHYIVALELVEHSTIPCDPCILASKPFPECYPTNRLMNMRVRIKIIDIRGPEPKVVLYEILRNSYVISPSADCVDYEKVHCGCQGFHLTPCGKMHQRLIRSLSARIEEVLGCTY